MSITFPGGSQTIILTDTIGINSFPNGDNFVATGAIAYTVAPVNPSEQVVASITETADDKTANTYLSLFSETNSFSGTAGTSTFQINVPEAFWLAHSSLPLQITFEVDLTASFDLLGQHFSDGQVKYFVDLFLVPPDLTTPAQTVYEKMYQVVPSAAELAKLTIFDANQYAYALQVHFQDPLVYVYSALGQALAEASDTGSTLFKDTAGPLHIPSDATFVTEGYNIVFGHPGTQAQIQHFVDQLNFYEKIYTASGAFGTDANRIDLLARGAIFGQMLGVNAENPPVVPAVAVAAATAATDTPLVGVSGQHDLAHGMV